MDNYISCFWSSWWTLKYLQASENTIMSAVKNRSGETFSHVFMGFLQVLQFPSTVKNHAGWGSLFTPQKVWMWVWIIFRLRIFSSEDLPLKVKSIQTDWPPKSLQTFYRGREESQVTRVVRCLFTLSESNLSDSGEFCLASSGTFFCSTAQ